MAPDAAVTVESSPTEILASLTPEEKAKWRQTGNLPEPKKEIPKESTTEAVPSPAATTDVTEPAKAAETTAAPVAANQEHKPNKGAEARIKELLAANKKLEVELEAARRAPVVTPAKIEEVAKPHRYDVDPKTGQAMYATDAAFDEAFETYLTAKVTADVEKRHAKARQDERIAEQNRLIEQRWQNALKIANEKHEDFAKVLDIGDEEQNGKMLKNIFRNKDLKTIKTNGVLDAWILDSEIGAEMLYHFAKNPSEIARIQSLSAFAAARELTKIEEKLSAPPSASTKKEEKPAESSSTAQVTRAPAPAASVSGKATAPVDEVEAAVKDEDFSRFKRVANREDFAKRTKS